MTPQQLLGTAVRLFSIWMALSSVAYFAAIPSALSSDPLGENSVALSYAVGVGYVLVAVLLWFFPMFVAHKLVPQTSHTNRLELSGFQLARVGVGILGLWLLAKAVPTLSWVLFRSFLFVQTGSTISALTPELKVEIGVAVVELLIALFFIVKSASLANMFVPTLGQTKEAHDEL